MTPCAFPSRSSVVGISEAVITPFVSRLSSAYSRIDILKTYTMLWLGLLSLPAAVQAQGFSTTMLRFGCSQITIDRIDPYVFTNHHRENTT
jgi:hypothetical protein